VLALTREMALSRLLEVPRLVDLQRGRDPAFPEQVLAWLGRVEEDFQRLRSPVVALVAGQRAALLAAADGLRDPQLAPGTPARKAARAATALCLGRVEAALRQTEAETQARLDQAREKLVQLLAVASAGKPLPLPEGAPREAWLARVWRELGGNPATQSLYAYLSAALRPSDRLYLLGDVLDNLLANGSDGASTAG
jgi:hypothetical protein